MNRTPILGFCLPRVRHPCWKRRMERLEEPKVVDEYRVTAGQLLPLTHSNDDTMYMFHQRSNQTKITTWT